MIHAARLFAAPDETDTHPQPGWRPDPSPLPRRPTLDGPGPVDAVTAFTGFAVLVAVVGNLGLPLPGAGLAIDMWLVAVGFELARRVDPATRPAGPDGRWAKRYGLGVAAQIAAPSALAVALTALYHQTQSPLDEAATRAVLGAMTMTSNLFTIYGGANFPAIDHLWAVALIGQFALLVPLLAAWGHGRIRREQRASAIVGLAVGVAICRLGFTVTETAEHSSIALNTLTRADGLLIGAAIGVAPMAEVRRRVPPGLSAAAFAALLVLFLAAPAPSDHPEITLAFLVPLAALLAAVIVASASAGTLTGALSAILDRHILRWLGGRTIAIYVWHQIFGFALSIDLLGGADRLARWPGLALFVLRLIFTLAAAATSHRYLELPALAVARQIYRRPRSPGTSAPVGAG
jgi:peptidoglycan/LPS O-acetylase OafA/YrhL